VTVEELLAGWLPRQRWFAGKDRDITGVSIGSDVELIPWDPAHAGGAGMRHLLVAVRQGANVDHYQVPLGQRRELPQRLEYAALGAIDDVFLYDATHDPELMRALLENMAADATVGPLAFRTVPGRRIETDLDSLVSTAEQSNTSLIYGDTYICKLFRRVNPGPNPDLEINLALAEHGSEAIIAPYGWIETELAGETTTLAMLSEFQRMGTDGWLLAVTSVRDLYAEADLHADEVGGDFAAEAERLGSATAAVHVDLGTVFGSSELAEADVRAMAEQMRERLTVARAHVPELAPYTTVLGAAFDDLAKHDEPITVQRVHGDLHLGQVMRTEQGWALLDFEGEPAKPLAERRAPASPLRDVAGMLRSFEYAARHMLGGHPNEDQLEYRAREWIQRNRAAFCRGYADAGGIDPAANEILLRALEFDKAVYEVMYEARNRPSWLHIPLRSLTQLTG
jgi:maltokinase